MALGYLQNYNVRNKEIKTKLGRWTLLQIIKINNELQIK